MTDIGIAVGLHLLGVVWWIGGVTFVTLVFLPLARAGKLGDTQSVFNLIEGKFAPQAKTALIIVGATGLYMLYRQDAWSWFADPHKWWLTAMMLYWARFALMLFVLGPTGRLKRMMKGGGGDQSRAWRRLHVIHGVLMTIGFAIIFGAAGRYFFD